MVYVSLNRYVVSIGCVLFYSVPADARDHSHLTLRSGNIYCNIRNIVTYRPTGNGNLEYHYHRIGYDICIGSRFNGSPKTNDYVYLSKKACQVDNICQDALSYGEILRYFLFLFYLS